MNHFKAMRIHTPSGNFRLDTLRLDELSPGEVVVKVHYSSVNYKDALLVTGRGKIARRFPIVGGIDLAGVVIASTDANFRTDDPVLCTGCGLSEILDGGYAEIARLPAKVVVPLPAGLDLFEAMALGTAGFTAALSLFRMEQNGQSPKEGPIAISGATGGVGSIAINLLSHLGYTVMAISGKMDRRDYLHALGAGEVINRHKLDFADRPLLKARWAGALDAVGGKMLSMLIRSTTQGGNVAAYGMAGNTDLSVSVFPFILRGVSLLGITSANCPMSLRHRIWRRLATDWKPPDLQLIVRETVRLEDLPRVCEGMLAGRLWGRTVVCMEGI